MPTITLFAQPYDFNAQGFYFSSYDEYQEKAFLATNSFGDPVEEFELQFIDGEAIDADLAVAWAPNQATIVDFLVAVREWDEDRKKHYILAVREYGYRHADAWRVPDSIEIDIYYVASLRELAEQFLDEGIYGEIPDPLRYYIDFDAIARDLGMEFSESVVAGERLVHACR